MMDFVLEAWVSSIIEGKKIQWMLSKREPWHPGEKLKLLFCGLQRDAQHRIGRARGRNAPADPADSGAGERRPQHDDV
jgi:hypothetical protein